MSKGLWYRQEPVWGAGIQSGGPAGPDYSQALPPQPGEAPELLPRPAPSDEQKARQQAAAIRRGQQSPGARMRPPYVTVQASFVSNGSLPSILVDLGKPDSGFRWLVRSLAVVSSVFNVVGSAGAPTFYYYIGSPPGSTLAGSLAEPAPFQFLAQFAPSSAAPLPQIQYPSSHGAVVLGNQHLLGYALAGGATPGQEITFAARVEVVPDYPGQTVEDL